MKALALALLMSVVIATPAASGATSPARAKRLAAKALAPQPVRRAFCLPPLLAGGRAVDKWFCAVWLEAPAGQQCTALVNVSKGRAKVVRPVVCTPVPAPLGGDKRYEVVGAPATPVPALSGSLGEIKGNRIKKSALKRSYPLRVTCTADSAVAATLDVTSSLAKKLKVKVAKGQKYVAIAWALGECKATGGGTLRLVLAPPVKSKVLESKGTLAVTLRLVEYTTPESTPFRTSRPLELT